MGLVIVRSCFSPIVILAYPIINLLTKTTASRSFIPTLSSLISSGLPTLIWAGDADAVCDWFGAYDVVNQISYPQSSTFRSTKVSEYKTNGVVKGEFKSVGKLSWLRVFQCGHTVMSEQPEMSLQVFRQMMERGGLRST